MATSNSPEGRLSQGTLKPKPNSKWANVLNLEVNGFFTSWEILSCSQEN